jgi:hypothetical protein
MIGFLQVTGHRSQVIKQVHAVRANERQASGLGRGRERVKGVEQMKMKISSTEPECDVDWGRARCKWQKLSS